MSTEEKKPHNRIAELRKEKHLTIQQLADEIGVANGTISRYEQGSREPKLETWMKLAEFFNVPVAYLMGTEKLESIFKSFYSYTQIADRKQITRYSKILETVLESFDDSNRKHLEKLQDEIKEANDLKEFEFLMSELMTIFLYAKSGNSKEADECYTKVQEIIEDFAGSLPEFQIPSPDIRPQK